MGNATAREVAHCFMAGQAHKKGNYESTGHRFYIFGNLVARKMPGILEITDAGRKTQTTARGLNCLPGVNLRIRNGKWELNSHDWDGKWKSIEKDDPFRRIRALSAIADLLCEDKAQRNRCKTLAIESLPGIEMPSDWNSLSEEEKERRLNGALEELK
jgi:hypothetical protein